MNLKRQKKVEELKGPRVSRPKLVSTSRFEDSLNDHLYSIQSQIEATNQKLIETNGQLVQTVNRLRLELQALEKRVPDHQSMYVWLVRKLIEMGVYEPPSAIVKESKPKEYDDNSDI